MILICLLLVGVKMNPSPTRHATRPINAAGARNITVGALNARSVVNKAAEINLTIEDERLDVLAVSETWIPLEAPDAISGDMAPPGFHVINAPCSDGRQGGGLAIIHRDNLKVTPVKL